MGKEEADMAVLMNDTDMKQMLDAICRREKLIRDRHGAP